MSTEAEARFPSWKVAVAVVLLGAVVYWLRSVLTPVFFAFLIAYALDPLVDRFEDRGLHRATGIVALLVSFTAALGLFLLLVVPGIVSEVAAVAEDAPAAIRSSLEAWEPVLTSYGLPVPHSLTDLFEHLGEGAQELAGQAISPVAAILGWVVGGTANAIGASVGLLMIPVFAFYLLHDFDPMMARIGELLPGRYRGRIIKIAKEIDEVLSQFVRGQLLVMGALCLLYGVGYSIVGVRLAIPIGIIAGLLAFIPYVGGAVALGLALLMCALNWQGWTQLAMVVAVYGIVQLLEGFVITPKIVGDKVGLSSVWVLFALMLGGEIFGFLGILLAVPAAAVLKIFVARGLKRYEASQLYLAEPNKR